jgi:hypothetical protein
MNHLSDLALDTLRLGRSALDEQHHLEGCGVCSDRMALLVADAAAFEDRFSAEALAAQTLAAPRPAGGWGALVGPRRGSGPRRGWWAGALAAAAAIVIVVAVPDTMGPAPTDRIKGAAHVGLKVRVRREGVVSEATSGQSFRDGDALMIGMNPGSHGRVRLTYRDTAGKEEVWFDGQAEPGTWTWTDKSFVLDGATGAERLTAVYGDGETVVFEVRKE